MKMNKFLAVVAVLTSGLLVLACGGLEPVEESVETMEEALEQPMGAMDMGDEHPSFADPTLDNLPLDVANMAIPEEGGLEQYTGVMPKTTSKKPPLLCPHGFLKGKWKPFKPGAKAGKFIGKWARSDGTALGHLRGFYGRNKMGHGVFFGKYIGLKGKFKGLLAGRYGKGFFRGRWIDKSGVRGKLRGVYAKGVFKGRWVRFCKLCKVTCKPGFKPGVTAWGKCVCLPPNVVPCLKGKCPKGMFCKLCPVPPKCKLPGAKCPSVCAPPVCKKLPPLPPKGGKKAPGKTPSNGSGSGSGDNIEQQPSNQ